MFEYFKIDLFNEYFIENYLSKFCRGVKMFIKFEYFSNNKFIAIS